MYKLIIVLLLSIAIFPMYLSRSGGTSCGYEKYIIFCCSCKIWMGKYTVIHKNQYSFLLVPNAIAVLTT